MKWWHWLTRVVGCVRIITVWKETQWSILNRGIWVEAPVMNECFPKSCSWMWRKQQKDSQSPHSLFPWEWYLYSTKMYIEEIGCSEAEVLVSICGIWVYSRSIDKKGTMVVVSKKQCVTNLLASFSSTSPRNHSSIA